MSAVTRIELWPMRLLTTAMSTRRTTQLQAAALLGSLPADEPDGDEPDYEPEDHQAG